jgi:hypothetical protein
LLLLLLLLLMLLRVLELLLLLGMQRRRELDAIARTANGTNEYTRGWRGGRHGR